ncbi:polar amino acid transport system substrate-binding protein [Azospirillaceae bacterium]
MQTKRFEITLAVLVLSIFGILSIAFFAVGQTLPSVDPVDPPSTVDPASLSSSPLSDSGVALTSEEREFLMGRSLRLGIDVAWPPFEFLDDQGNYSGVSSEFINFLSSRLGFRPMPQTHLSWNEALEKIKSGDIDVLPMAASTPQRNSYLLFTRPYIHLPAVIITRNEQFIGSLEELVNRTVGVVKGYSIEEHLRRDYPGISLVSVSNLETGLRALANNQIEAFIDGLDPIVYSLEKLGLRNQLKISGITPYTYDLAIAVRKDWPLAASAIDKILAGVSSQEKSVMKERWLSIRPSSSQSIDWFSIGPLCVAFVIVAVCGVFWIRRLKQTIQKRRNIENTSKEHARRLEARSAVQKRLSELSSELQRAVSFEELGSVLLSGLVPMLKASHGVFYIYDQDRLHLSLIGGYGHIKQKNLKKRFSLGEYLIGQCAVERESLVLIDPPEDYVHVVSGLGEARPRTILVTPIIHNDRVLGVLELASFNTLEGEERELLDSFLPVIAMSLEILDRTLRTQTLLDASRRQANTLEEQSIALQAQQGRLMETETWFRGIIESAPDGMLVVDARGKIILCNTMAGVMFGYAHGELIGADIDALTPCNSRDEHTSNRSRFLRHGETRSMGQGLDLCGVRKDGSEFPIEVSLAKLPALGGRDVCVCASIRDITLRKLVENEVKRASAILNDQSAFQQALIDAIPNPIFYKGSDTRFLGCNLAYEEAFGIPRATFIGKKVLELDYLPEDDRRRYQEEDERIIAETGRLDREISIPYKDGRLHDALYAVRGFLNACGRPGGLIGIIVDITAQKQIEQDIKRARDEAESVQKQLVDMSEALPLAVFRLVAFPDGHKSFAFVGSKVREILGVSAEEMQLDPESRWRHIHPDDLAQCQERLDAAFARAVQRETNISVEMVYRVVLDGQIRWVATLAFARYAPDASVIWNGFHRDITERRRAEVALAEAEERGRLILDSTGEGLFGIDAEGRVTFINPVACRMLGVESEAMIGEPSHSVFHYAYADGSPYPQDKCRMMEVMKDGVGRFVTDEVFWSSDGRSIPVEYNATPIRKDGVIIGAVVCWRDVSERRRVEAALAETEELRKARAAAVEAARVSEEARAVAVAAEAALREKMDVIERFNRLATGREQRVVELKAEVNRLAFDLNRKTPYREDVAPSRDSSLGGGAIPNSGIFENPEGEIKKRFSEILQAPQIKNLLNDYCSSVDISMAIIDLEANILASSRWRRVCTDFHRVHEETCRLCIESDVELALNLQEGKDFSLYHCKNGLIDSASPILVEGVHVANAFIGQFHIESPNRDFFMQRAALYGFDSEDYWNAVNEAPVIDEEKLPSVLAFLTNFAKLIASLSLSRMQAELTEAAMRCERAAAMSLAEDAELARAELTNYQRHLEELVFKRARELQKAEERSRLILDTVEEGIFGVDNHGLVTFINPAAARMLGYVSEELAGKFIHDVIHHTLADGKSLSVEACPISRSRSQAASSAQCVHIQDGLFWRKNGSYFHVDYTATPMIKDGVSEGVVVVFRDITSQKHLDETIRQERNSLRCILDSSPIAIGISVDGIVKFCNDTYRQWTGLTLGDSTVKVYANPADRERLIARLKSEGVVRDQEVRMRGLDGVFYDLLVTYSVIQYEGQTGVLGWLMNVTKFKIFNAVSDSPE